MSVADERFETLHRLRIVGRADADSLPAAIATIDALVADGLVRSGARGCSLTGDGLRAHEVHLAERRAALPIDELERAYQGFLKANQPVKDACAAWQTAATTATDSDVVAVIDGLDRQLSAAKGSFVRAGRVESRFGNYLSRLESALDQVSDGDRNYITDPDIASFHTVWFECHEDYLLTLGRSREEEED